MGFLLVIFHTLARVGGVAGWNITPEVMGELGTLLGPEETPAGLVGCFFWWPLPAWTV